MEDLLFRVEYPVIKSSSEVGFQDNSISSTNGRVSNSVFHTQVNDNNMFRFEVDDNLIKTQILNHPRYPDLVATFIDCQKVGAPAEMGYLLEEINLKNFSVSCCSEIGADPELDYFMESYCEILHRYKEELSKTFNEAKAFLNSIESQLSDLCKESFALSIMDYRSDEAAVGTSEEELSCGEVEVSESVESMGVRSADEELKVMLLKKYSGYLSSLRKEFLHKRKRGKLPKDSRTLLMDWWNSHYRWPYPTEEEKQKLSDETGLDQKQINNWFINQRKRHWKPSEDMRSVLTQTVRSSVGYGNSNTGPPFFDQ